MRVTVAVLGPLELERDGRPLQVAPGRDVRLLALLVINVGVQLPSERIVQELWGGEPPRTAVSALYNSVSRLRRALGDDVLLTQNAGYMLAPGGTDVDAHRFERLIRDAADADPASAVAQLREALGLWRGPPLTEVAYEPFAQTEIARLDELRVSAVEQRIECELELGRHAGLVAELRSLIDAHPFREQLRRQLMLALYRTGRQADALAAYADARRVFADELGIEPSPLLQDVERAILRHEVPAARDAPAHARPMSAQAPLAAERRGTVTALFCDLVASTALAGKLDPEALKAVLLRYFAVVRAAIEHEGGVVEKFIGDAVLGVFGVPRAHEDDALCAVRAAAAARSALVSLNRELRSGWGVELHARFGLDTGEVVAGGEAIVTGEALALAKRIEEAAAPGEILLGETTWRLVRGAVDATPRSLASGASAWVVTSIGDGEPFARRLETPLVGRRRELSRLHEALADAAGTSTSQLFTLLGPAGVGKTRVALEFASEAAATATVTAARAPHAGRAPSSEVVTELLERLPQSPERDDGLALERSRDATPEELALATKRALDRAAAEGPVVVVLDDLHRAAASVLDLVEYLVDALRGAPVLLVCTGRLELLEERPDWGGGKVNATSLLLEPLSEREALELVDTFAGPASIGAGERTELAKRSEGNPLFLEQLLAAFLLGEPADFPPTLQALLAARLDRLGPAERAVVDAAAVFGREFPAAAVAELVPAAAASWREHLGALIRKDFVRPLRRPGEREPPYAFRHGLVRDVAYRTTAKSRRAELHLAAARQLERSDADDAAIGHHLAAAFELRAELGRVAASDRSLAAAAGERLGRAGLEAWKASDARTAEGLFTRATALLPDGEARRGLLCELALALWTTGRLEDARRTATEARRAAAAANDARHELRARVELAYLRLVTNRDARASAALDVAAHAVDVFERAGDERALGRARLLTGFVRGGLRCENEALRQSAELALAHYTRAGWPPATCVSSLCASLLHGPLPVAAAIERCQRLRAEVPVDAATAAGIELVVAHLEAMTGDFAAARRRAADARATLTELGLAVRAAEAAGWALSEIEVLAGRADAAEPPLRESCELLTAMRAHAPLATRAAALADVLYLQGRLDEADGWCQTAERHAGRDDLSAQFAWRAVRGKLLARRGGHDEADRVAHAAVSLSAPTDSLNARARCLLDLAEVLRTRGCVAESAAHVQQALELYERKENSVAAERAARLLAEPAAARADRGSSSAEGPAGPLRATLLVDEGSGAPTGARAALAGGHGSVETERRVRRDGPAERRRRSEGYDQDS